MTEQTERRVVAQPTRQVIQQVGERIELTEAELALMRVRFGWRRRANQGRHPQLRRAEGVNFRRPLRRFGWMGQGAYPGNVRSDESGTLIAVCHAGQHAGGAALSDSLT